MKEFKIAVLSPPGLPDPSLPISASRTCALGILDLEYTYTKEVALEGIRKLARYAQNDFGIKLDSGENTFLDMSIF